MQKFKLSEIVDFNPENLKNNNDLEFINYLDTANITEGKIDEIKKMYLNEQKIPSRAKRIVQINDIVYSSVRPNLKHYGILKKIEKNLIVSTGFIVLRAKHLKISPDYLYNFLRLENNIEFVSGIAETSTTTYPSITSKVLEDLEINLPPLKTQEKIASILSTLDDKIEINNEMNKTLEEMAQTLFKRWFIDFDFPNESGEPYKSSGGKMVDSELGEIPKGWEVNSLIDVCLTISSGGTPNTKTREYYGDEINWYSTKELQDKFLLESEKKITQLGLNKSSAKIFPKDSILMAIYAAPTVGRLGILIEESAFNQAAVGLVTDEVKISYEYVYLYLLKERNNLNNLSNGAAQQNLNVSIVKNYKIIVPSKELNQLFKNIISSKFLKIKKNQQEIQSLTEIRDILLPKLMSGEVEI